MSELRVPDLNQVLVAGRLTRDPELKYTSGGMAYCKLGVANTRYYKDKQGQRAEQTAFLDVTVWGQQAEFVGEKILKGHAVLVEARLVTNEWEDRQTGQKRSRLELNAHRITPLEWHGSAKEGGATEPPKSTTQAAQQGTGTTPAAEEFPEDDIPF